MKTKQRAAIVCASGFGDALLMQIAAAHLKRRSFQTVTFSPHLKSLARWFPGFEFESGPIDSASLKEFDTIILEHDNSARAKQIRMLPQTRSFFPSYVSSKHGPLRPRDVLFDRNKTMAENIAKAMGRLYPGDLSYDNGICPPDRSTFRCFSKRVAIHPVSSSPDKNWRKEGFLRLAEVLARRGWEPMFITPPEEAHSWGAPLIPDLDALTTILYQCGYFIGNDSGPGHLASNLGIPTLTIGPNKQHLALWRPGWSLGRTVAPPSLFTNFKLTRTFWQFFISVDDMVQEFILISKKDLLNQLKLEKGESHERFTPPSPAA